MTAALTTREPPSPTEGGGAVSATARPPERCGHGLPLTRDVRCIQCEIAWHEWCLKNAKAAVKRHTIKLAALTTGDA